MKILFICDYFFPDTQIAGKRTLNFALGTEKLGHDVTVLCGDCTLVGKENANDLPFRTIYARYSKTYLHMQKIRKKLREQQHKFILENKKRPIFFRLKEFILLSFWAMFRFGFEKKSRGKAFFREAKKMTDEVFDACVVSFSLSANPLCKIPVYLKKRGVVKKWILDSRDALFLKEKRGKLVALNPRYARFLNKVATGADTVTAVSAGQVEMLKTVIKTDKPYEILYNGYESESLPRDTNCSAPLKLVFTGTFYPASKPQISDVSALFRAIRFLIDEKKCDEKHFEIHYAGNEFFVLAEKATEYALDGILVDHGYVERSEIPKIQNSAHIQLLFSRNTRTCKGNLGGKFGEYIGNHLPILAFIKGDEPDSEVKNLIEKYGLGFTYEYCKDNFDELSNFLLTEYDKVFNNKHVKFTYKSGYTEFGYANIVKKLENILKNDIV